MTWKTLFLTSVLSMTTATVLAQSTAKGSTMMQARGTFEVKVTPTDHAPDTTIASMALDKAYHGDLEATARGEMLSSGDPKAGNAGYVAMERVSGTLAGHTGTFAIMQSGTMSAGTPPQMTVTIVPGSGTEQMSGIYGTMTVTIVEGKHTYTLDYQFAKK